jgi:transposase
VIADKGFDADERVIVPLEKAGRSNVIPPKANRKHKRDYDKDLCQARHLIENFFAKLNAPSPPAMTSGPSISWQESTSPRSSSGLIEDRP